MGTITLITIFRRSNRFQKIFFGSLGIMSGTVINSLTRVASIAILTRYYSKEEFGLWVAITSLTAITITGDFGISNALRNRLSSLAVLGNPADNQAHHYYLSAFYFFLLLGIFLSLLLILFYRYIPLHLFFKTSNIYILQSGIEIIVISQAIIFLGIPFGLAITSFFSYQESQWYSIVNVLQSLFNLLVIFILVYCKASIVTIGISYFAIGLFMGIMGTFIFLFKRKWNLKIPNIREIIAKNFEMAPLGMRFFAVQISNSLLLNSITLVIGASISLTDAGEYNLVQKLYMFFLALYLSISNPLWAGYSDATNRNDWLWCHKALKVSLIFTFLIFVLLIGVMLLFGNSMLNIIAGNKYSTTPIIYILVGLWTLINAIGNCSSQVQNSLGRLNIIIIVNVCVALIAVPFLSYVAGLLGLLGIIIGGIVISLPGAIITPLQAHLIIKKQIRKVAYGTKS